MTAAEHDAKFAMMVGHIRIIAETFLNEHFGERCRDLEPLCEICARWAALDRLTCPPGTHPGIGVVSPVATA